MPYIKNERKKRLVNPSEVPKNTGELTYLLFDQCLDYMYIYGRKFQTLAEILGALEAAKIEFYRRIVAPYEDEKIAENGDCI